MTDVLTTGRLEDQPFPALAGRIFREGRTGGLSLESGGRRRTVWFLGGNPAAVVSADPEDHIARFLLEHGHINEEEHTRLATLPETRDGIAGADFLPKDALNWGVKFRFVNLCYDLFRWEEGDFSFAEGNPPRELFLLKVPGHSLIFKGIGYLGRARLLDLVPDEALLSAGEVVAEQARYLGPAEREVLAACRPGGTVAALLEDIGREDRERTRALVYAFVCLGLLKLAAAAPRTLLPSPSPTEDDAAFTLEEPGADAADAFSLPESHRDPGPCAPAPDAGTGTTTGADLEAALAVATGRGRLSFEDEGIGGSSRSFDDSFTAESATQPPALPGEAEAAPAPRPASRKPRATRRARLAGIALGAAAAGVIIVAAAWWWLSGETPPPSPPAPAPVERTATPPQSAPARPQAVPPIPPTAPAPPPSPSVATVPLPAAPPPPQKPPAFTDRYRNGLDVFRAGDLDGAAAIWEDQLALEHPDEFTLLLLTACQRETIRDTQKSLPARKFYLVPKQVRGRNCFRVCVDTFRSRDAAARALAGLPSRLRTGGASVRSVADVLKR